MKINTLLFAAVLLGGLVSTGCKKAEDDLDKGFSPEIQRIVPAAVIDTMRRHGMVVHEGRRPPKVDGIYLFSKNELKGSSLASDTKGALYADYRYQFYEQDEAALTLKTSFKGYSGGTVIDQALGKGSFLAGSGNSFTVFSEENGTTSDGASYSWLTTYSGVLDGDGIKNFQFAFYMKDKNDPGNTLVPVGTTRVFDDQDGFSESMSSLRLRAAEALANQPAALPAGAARR